MKVDDSARLSILYDSQYLPAIANAVLDYNEAAASPILFSGLAIGNGCARMCGWLFLVLTPFTFTGA
jgi:hypothetical protein